MIPRWKLLILYSTRGPLRPYMVPKFLKGWVYWSASSWRRFILCSLSALMITIPLYNETVIAPTMQTMVPSTLAMPSLLKNRTSSNLHAARNCHSNYIHGPRNPMFSKEYIYKMSQLIYTAISEYDILFHVLKLETLFSIIHVWKSYVLQGISIHNMYEQCNILQF